MKVFVAFLLLFGLLSCGQENHKQQESNTQQNLPLDSLLSIHPDSVNLLVTRAKLRYERSLFDLMLADAAHAFSIDSNRTDVQLAYAKALLNYGQATIQDKLNSKRLCAMILEKDSSNVEALIDMANHFAIEENFDEGFRLINKALRIDPRARDAYFLKASMYRILGNYKLMLSSFETTISIDPNFINGYFYIGSYYEHIQNPICIEYYKSAHNLAPSNADFLYPLAYAYSVFDQPKAADSLYRKMISIDSTAYIAYFHLGYLKQFVFEEIDSAFAYYDQTLRINPLHIESLHNKGLLYEEIGDKANALFTYGKALRINPEYEVTKARVKALR